MPRDSVLIHGIAKPGTRKRLMAKLVRVGPCLVFTGMRNSRGYGIIEVMIQGKRYPMLTHRLAWVIAHDEPIPDDRIICHKCDNPGCCEPAHLYLGTHASNAADRVNGRRRRLISNNMRNGKLSH